jgi:stage II sporulation protein B
MLGWKQIAIEGEGDLAVDKLENGKTITIKINGKNRPVTEISAVEDEKIINQGVNKEAFSEKEKNEEQDVEETTRIETAASKPMDEDDPFDWILPDDEELKEYQVVTKPRGSTKKGKKGANHYTNHNKSRNGIIKSIVSIIFFAVLIGSTFGIIMLKMVITERNVEHTVPPVNTVEDTGTKKESTEKVSFPLKPITAFVVQAGAFSSKESAEKERKGIEKKNVPVTVVSMDDKFFLFLGVADTLENAKFLGGSFKEKGISIYAKETQFGGTGKMEVSESEKVILENAPSFFKALSAVNASAAVSNESSPDLMKTVKALSNNWAKIDAKEIQNEKIKKIKGELDEAFKKMTSYAEKPDGKLLIESQQHLLNFLGLYHSL